MKLFNYFTYSYRIPRYFIRKAGESLRSFLWRSDLSSKYKKQKKALSRLRDSHKGKPCILIGGGPSINKMDLDLLEGYITIACNGFYLKHDQLSFVPTYYTVEDPLPALDNKNEINSIKNTIRIIPYDLKNVIDQPENTIYVNFRRSAVHSMSPRFPYYSHDFLNEAFWGGTVMYFNIQLAEYLGCNPIYLIGVDLSYNIPDSVKRTGAVLTSTADDENHFDPRYFGAGKRWHLPETARMQHAFDRARDELAGRGIDLINAGVDSQLKNIPKARIF